MPPHRKRTEIIIGNGRYTMLLNNVIGQGGFGKVYLGQDRQNGMMVAIKTEEKSGRRRKNKKCALEMEHNILSYVSSQDLDADVPAVTIHWYGADSKRHYLVMTLLGKSLASMLKTVGMFPLKSVMLLSERMIKCVKHYHDRKIIHRDIKPGNFLTDVGANCRDIYLIDFGLAKKYVDNGVHIQYRDGKPQIGTPSFMSINAHEHKELSRRDDMYSLGYLIIYMLIGKLPWSGLQASSGREREKMIYNMKIDYTPDKLASYISNNFDCPSCLFRCTFTAFLQGFFMHIDSLAFTDAVNYEALLRNLDKCIRVHSYERDYLL